MAVIRTGKQPREGYLPKVRDCRERRNVRERNRGSIWIIKREAVPGKEESRYDT